MLKGLSTLFVSIMVVASYPDATEAVNVPQFADIPFATFDGCPGTCHECPTWGGHNAQAVDPSIGTHAEGENGWHGCEGGSNCDGHFCETQTEEDGDLAAVQPAADVLEELRMALVSDDMRAFRRILAASGLRLQVVKERSSLQMLGCGGRVVLNFPLTVQQLQVAIDGQ